MKTSLTEIDPADLPLVMDEPHSVLENLYINGEGASPDTEFAILFRADHCIARNVYVRDMPKIGIGARGVRNALIERAHVYNCQMQGIWNERDCDGSMVTKSHVLNTGFDGIQLGGTNGSAVGNRVEGAGMNGGHFAGIYVMANSREMSIERNVCKGNGTGIDVSWGFQNGPDRNGGDPSNGVIVHGNKCSGNNSCGIATASNGTILTANQCLNNNVVPSEIGTSGIGLVNASGCNITGGNVMIGQTVGLLFVVNGAGTNASRNCLIASNHFEGHIFPIRQWFSRRLSEVSTTRGHVLGPNFGYFGV